MRFEQGDFAKDELLQRVDSTQRKFLRPKISDRLEASFLNNLKPNDMW